jgi:hypothetical protein
MAEEDVRKLYINENVPYTKAQRVFGSGKVRIGTTLSFREDIYALMFLSNFKLKLI